MYDKIKILDLINQKQIKQFELESLIYGSIEVRDKGNSKYIYIHTREEGVLTTKYVGEYTEVLYNVILNNNIRAKEIKQEIRKIDKKLKRLDFIDEELSVNVNKNVDFAKRNLVNTIYKQAMLEGVSTTLSDTENIIEGGKINNISPEDVLKIINLKHAWEFVLNKNVLISKTDYNVLCMINRLVLEGFYYNAGMLRTIPVDIGGTSWKPELPIESDIKKEIEEIINSGITDIDISIKLLLYVVKKQMFIDGNKRSSVIFANHYLISKGKGYYETDNNKKIFNFIKKECYLKI